MSRHTERVCRCGCGEAFMARSSDVARGFGLYKNRSHARRGANNPGWKGGIGKDYYRYKKQSIARFPNRHRCRRQYEYAIRIGLLKRGCCEFCGSTKTDGHHENYDEPYNVRWLCKRHHRMADRWRRERELPPSGMPTLGLVVVILHHTERMSRCVGRVDQTAWRVYNFLSQEKFLILVTYRVRDLSSFSFNMCIVR